MWTYNGPIRKNAGLSNYRKGIVVAVNIYFMVFGITLVYLANSYRQDFVEYAYFLDFIFFVFIIMMKTIGILNIVMGAIGIYSTLKEHFNLIFSYTYSIVLIILALSLLAADILGEELVSSAENYIASYMNERFINYNVNDTDDVYAWDDIQTKFKCCGIELPYDWLITHNILPSSCCAIPPTSLLQCDFSESNIYLHQNGCLDSVVQVIRADLTSITAIGVGFFVVQAVCLLTTFVIGCCLRKSRQNGQTFQIYDRNLNLPPGNQLNAQANNKERTVYM